jgi:hypothetical protein
LNLLEKIGHDLRSISERRTLDSSSFSFCFPVCHGTFHQKAFEATYNDFMFFVEKHVDCDGDFPRDRMIESLLHVMNHFQPLQERSKKALLILSRKTPGNPNELVLLLQGILSPQGFVRFSTLQSIEIIFEIRGVKEMDLMNIRLWISRHDSEEETRSLADKLWKIYNRPLINSFLQLLLADLSQTHNVEVQAMIGRALAGTIKVYPERINSVLHGLYDLYKSKKLAEDDVGILADEGLPIRCGVATCLGCVGSSDVISAKEMTSIFEFFFRECLDDKDKVRERAIDSGLDILKTQGKRDPATLLSLFERTLEKKSLDMSDRVQQSIVVFMGALAGHFPSGDPRVTNISNRLLETLKLPSEQVQRAIAKCFIQLGPALGEAIEQIVNMLLERVQNSQVLHERRGAAIGLAGVVKGLGISSLKKYNIVTALQNALEDKKHPHSRQGALLAIEYISNILEKLFEPYLIQIIPKLLICFGTEKNSTHFGWFFFFLLLLLLLWDVMCSDGVWICRR